MGSENMPRLQIQEIPDFLGRYNAAYPDEDGDLQRRRERIRRERKMQREDLFAVCKWKTPRTAGLALRNTNCEVEEITACALRSQSERVRVEVLQTLHGVGYPVASVILHFYHTDIYPILDDRALWSMNINEPSNYTFPFWWEYVQACRRFLERARQHYPDLTMRELDRALWKYAEERQTLGHGSSPTNCKFADRAR